MDNITKIIKFNEIAGNARVIRGLDEKLPRLYMSLIHEEHVEELVPAHESGDLRGVLDGAADLIVVAAGLIHSLGFDVNEVLAVICDSNLSKFDTTEEDADRSVASYESDERYTEVHHTLVGDRYVIRGKKAGEEEKGWKILKSHKFKEPDLSKFLGEQNE